jgi:cyclopropane fatty-acyl-phospholipid synthase-like methyltransferase
MLAIKENGLLLELCRGDGFNAKYFYSNKAQKIISIDFDKNAILHANKFNKKQNIDLIESDIRNEFPDIKFDNIIWDAAIEHFTRNEIKDILAKIKDLLIDNGILSGYTIVENESGKQHSLLEYEFKSKKDLLTLIEPYFKKSEFLKQFILTGIIYISMLQTGSFHLIINGDFRYLKNSNKPES